MKRSGRPPEAEAQGHKRSAFVGEVLALQGPVDESLVVNGHLAPAFRADTKGPRLQRPMKRRGKTSEVLDVSVRRIVLRHR